MPRTRRLVFPGVLVHVRCRFVDGRFTFDDSARRHYLVRLDRALAHSDWTLLSYALMSSHIHLGMVAGQTELRSWLHPLNTAVAGWINTRRRLASPRTLGQVFGDRPGTNLLPLERAFSLIAYHHNNPVHAGATDVARNSAWTSHQQYLGCASHRVYNLNIRRGLTLCNMDARAFDTAVNDAAKRPSMVEAEPVAIVNLVSRHFGLEPVDVAGGSRSRTAVAARRVAVLLGNKLGCTSAHMAAALRISPAATSRLRQTATADHANVAHSLAADWRVVDSES